MKRLLSALLLAVVLFSQVLVSQTQGTSTPPDTPKSSSTRNHENHAQQKCIDNGTYVNSQGQTVKRPETCSGPPDGATARCRDGAYSFSRSRRGTCSHHGGVAKWL
jgi:uncharacterized protein DUF3761